VILLGDCISRLAELESESVQCCITSPPYWGLRDYGVSGQMGLEETPEHYVGNMRMVFEQVRRVLRPDGTLWLNLGDSYNAGRDGGRGGKQGAHKKYAQRSGANVVGLKPKDLVGIPWRVAFALQSDGWILRQDIIWHKPNPMPESVRDRCTKSHEYIFLFSKSKRYYYDCDAIREPSKYPNGPNSPGSIKSPYGQGFSRESEKRARDKIRAEGLEKGMRTHGKWNNPKGKNKRSVWTITPKPFKGAHFATFPPDLIEPCVLAGSRPNDTILDPFFGAGTVGLVAMKHQRNWIGIELNESYVEIAKKRLELPA
jgi:DNA modification methylase